MNLNSKKIYLFIKDLIKKFKTNIVITQGFKNVDVLDKFKLQYFKNQKSNQIKFKDKSIILIEDASFRDLENIVKNCKILICCEGAISHVSHSLNKKTISLVQKDRIITTNFWIGHMKNIKTVLRDDIKKVTRDILKLYFI